MPEQRAESRALVGRRILVSRPREQAEELTEALRRHGAEVVAAPAIRVEPPLDWSPLDAALRTIETYDWVIFTSVNGVRFVLERARLLGTGLPELARAKLAAIGPATRDELEGAGLRVVVVPHRFVAEEVYEALRQFGPLGGSKALLPRADIAREALPELLRKEGVAVDVVVAYRTVVAREEIRRGADLVSRGLIDVVTFTSGSTVRGFFSVIHEPEGLRDKFVAASIGPITTRALRDHGFEPGIEAKRYTAQGLVEAIVRYYEAMDHDAK